MFALVLIEYGVKVLDKTFTYKIPNNINVKIGNKVKVLFNNKVIFGIVIDIVNDTDLDNVLDIIDVVNPNIYLNKELIELGYYLKDNTFCTLIKAYQTMLPSSLKVKNISANYNKYKEYIVLNKDDDYVLKYINDNKRSKVKIDILNKLLSDRRIEKKGFSVQYKKLLEDDIIRLEKEKIYRINSSNDNLVEYTLTNNQMSVVNNVMMDTNNVYLLHGITGSGKTVVYIELIKRVLKLGKSAIMLVPEISLTTQMVNRFYNSFGDDVAIIHSGLSDGEKYDEYTKINNKEVHVVVGTRSAIFSPLDNIGLIVIDEEHSSTYKQENNPRYNAIDIAKKRCEYNNCPLILGSATPSLESYSRALKNVYKLLVLNTRVGDYNLPKVELVDSQKEMKKRNMLFSDRLKEEIMNTLENGMQAMILLNRRGFSTFVSCQNCGYTYKCPHCEITLTYHKSTNNLRCHYCGYTTYLKNVCPNCGEDAIRNFGTGTEKIESELVKLFPGARILRMDADTTSKKGSHDKFIKMIENEEVDIIVGTQMISKGLDFPKINLVGVINADETLNIPDFRSNEKTFQLLNQVSGRAGRSGIDSKVIIQTFNPDNILFNYIKNNDYVGFYKYEMNLRKKLKYPPYYFILSIKICSKDYDKSSKNATKIFNYLKNNIDISSIILGPSTASMFKLNNIYRFQIVVKYKFDNKLFDSIRFIDNMYINEKDVYLEIDNNPISI